MVAKIYLLTLPPPLRTELPPLYDLPPELKDDLVDTLLLPWLMLRVWLLPACLTAVPRQTAVAAVLSVKPALLPEDTALPRLRKPELNDPETADVPRDSKGFLNSAVPAVTAFL